MRSCYEAGRDGFWPHRWLTQLGVTNLVVDSSSIEVPRRARRAKTDRLDGEKLLRLLLRHWGGERGMWHVVAVPTREQEDARHASRGLTTLQAERTRYRNRIHSLLALHGVATARWTRSLPIGSPPCAIGPGTHCRPGSRRGCGRRGALLQQVEAVRQQARRTERQQVRATAPPARHGRPAVGARARDRRAECDGARGGTLQSRACATAGKWGR